MTGRNTLWVGAILAAALLALAGCATTEGGQSSETATVEVLGIDGVDSGRAVADSVWAGFVQEHRTRVSVTLDAGIEPTPEFFDYLVELAWSVNDSKPDNGLIVRIRTDPQVDVRGIAAEAGWSTPEFGFDEDGGYMFLDHVEDRFGPWPGNPPEAPTDALILRGSSDG